MVMKIKQDTEMGKTFRRNEGRRPKWDKHGQKSRKLREFEDKRFNKFKPQPTPELIETPDIDIPDFT